MSATPLQGKIFAITGASSGIGKALADAALKRGAKVAVCARNPDRLQQAYAGYSPDNLLYCRADVSKEEDCKRFIETVIGQWGDLDVLINNAGISMRALFSSLDLQVLRQLMDINYWGTVFMTKAALPYIRRRQGSIVGISSIAGYRGLPGRTGYSSSKFAMQGFLEALRTELLYDDVHVMWAAPGFTRSNIRNTALAADGNTQRETPLNEDQLMSAEECANRILSGICKRKRTVVMTLQGKATVWMNKLFPGWMDRMVYKHFAREPGSPLHHK